MMEWFRVHGILLLGGAASLGPLCASEPLDPFWIGDWKYISHFDENLTYEYHLRIKQDDKVEFETNAYQIYNHAFATAHLKDGKLLVVLDPDNSKAPEGLKAGDTLFILCKNGKTLLCESGELGLDYHKGHPPIFTRTGPWKFARE